MISCFCSVTYLAHQAKVVHSNLFIVTLVIQFIINHIILIEELIEVICLLLIFKISVLIRTFHKDLLLTFRWRDPYLFVLVLHQNLCWRFSILMLVLSLNSFDIEYFLSTSLLLYDNFSVVCGLFAF